MMIRQNRASLSYRASGSDKTFFYHSHQGKEKGFVLALRAAGYVPILAQNGDRSRLGRTRFMLLDLPRGRYSSTPAKVFFYPHAARPMVQWDGILAPWPQTACSFEHAPGGAEVLRRCGYPHPVEVVGWSYCEQRPFRPVEKVKRVLFGPIHPNGNGYLCPTDLEINRLAFQRVLAYCRASGAKLTVRYLRGIHQNGLEKDIRGVAYNQAHPNLTVADIDAADLVVAHQTLAYLAVARGKPVLMMGEDRPPRSGNSNENIQTVRSWELYADLLMYPLDILAGDGSVGETAELVQEACRGNLQTQTWRANFIGKPFDAAGFVRKLESYL